MDQAHPSGQEVARIRQEFIDLYLTAHPVEGTQLGIAGPHDTQLSPADPATRSALLNALTTRARALQTAASASGVLDDAVDGDLAVAGVRGLRIVEEGLDPYARNPGIYLDEAVRGIYSLLARTDLPAEQKLAPMSGRLLAIPGRLAQGRRQVVQAPRVLVDNAVGDAEGAVQFLEREFCDFLQALPAGPLAQDLERERRAAVEAVAEFGEFVRSLAETATDEFALGRESFEALLHDVHQVRYDATDLHELGSSVAAALEGDLVKVAKSTAGHDRWWELTASIDSMHPSRESLLDEYRTVLETARAFVAGRDLVDLGPVGPLVVRATPPFARANLPFAAYMASPPFVTGGRGEFWVSPPGDGLSADDEERALRRHHRGRLLVACVHEGYPGHHVQLDHASHVKRPVRNFFASTVFSEGWALHCEHLMRSEGFMLDGPDGPALNISMLRDQLWRALRIVIDVGLHCRGMTREEAVACLVHRHVLDRDSAAAEVMFYCSAPTQPMSYMVGRILLEDLIRRCHLAAGGSHTPLGRIRDAVLSHGSLPFPLLERVLGLTAANRSV